MTKEQVSKLIGEFTWDFGNQFFIETNHGNFIWSDPEYGGENTITKTSKTYREWISPQPFGRGKGTHVISNYCGKDFQYYES